VSIMDMLPGSYRRLRGMGLVDPNDVLPYEEGGLLVVCIFLVRALLTNVNNAYKIHIKNNKTNKQFEYELMIA
jgi:hypothetical protein